MSQLPFASTHAGPPAASKHRIPPTVISLLVGAAASAALFAHGVFWWPAPLLFFALHAVIAVIALVAVRWVVGPRTPESGGGSGGLLIQRPRSYDWLVRTITLGGEARLRRRILDLASPGPGEAVLDVGFGTGTLLVMAGERVGATGRLAGVEPAATMVEYARKKAARSGLTADLRVASAEQLPFETATFDVVFCTMVLHHVPADIRLTALNEIKRVLRPGGRMVIVDLERPRSVRRFLALVTLFHRLGSVANDDVMDEVAQQVAEAGFQSARRSIGNSGMSAIIGHVLSSNRD